MSKTSLWVSILFLCFFSGVYLFTLCYWVVQSLSHVWLFATTWTAAPQASLSFTISLSLLRPMSIELMMPSNHLSLRRLLLLLSSIFPSIRSFPVSWLFTSGGQMSFHFSPSNEYSGLFHLGLIGSIFFLPKELSGVFSNITVQKHQFFQSQTSLWSSSHISARLLEKP